MNINNVIIPAAGLGTRFLPYTKTVPKEMLPLLNKPAIDYIVREALGAGITNVNLIISDDKQALVNYFAPHKKLEAILAQRDKQHLLADVNELIAKAQFTFINQDEPLGLGHAISLAREAVGDNYFGVMLPDDIIVDADPALLQLMRIAREQNASVIAVQEVPQEQLSAYGVIKIKHELNDKLFEVESVVEKPQAGQAPSNLAIVGRYVLSPKLFPALEAERARLAHEGSNAELGLTDGLNTMLANGEKIFAYKFSGQRLDVGTPAGWLQAIEYLAKQ